MHDAFACIKLVSGVSLTEALSLEFNCCKHLIRYGCLHEAMIYNRKIMPSSVGVVVMDI